MPISEDELVSFAVVSPETGLVISTGRTDVGSLSATAAGNDVIAPIPADVRNEAHRYDWDTGEFIPIPEKPGAWAEWNGTDWTDTRTAESMAAEARAQLYAMRERTSLDKSTLLIRMAMAGMLPADEAEIAAGGVIPPTIQAALDALPPEVFPPEAQMIARIKWRSDNVISRVNPVIVLAAAALGVTDEQMDAIFDVQVPA